MSQNQTVKGLVLPTAKSVPGGSPGAAAIQMQKNSVTSQAKLINAVGGTKKKYGGTAKIVIPQFTSTYKVQNGLSQTPNNTIAQNARASTQGTENAKYDKYATQTGGKRKTKKNRNKKNKKGGYHKIKSGGRKRHSQKHKI